MTTGTVVGLLYPGHAAEDDYPLAEKLLGEGVALPVVHTSVGEDAHRVDALLDLGSEQRLVAGAESLRHHGVDAAVWACTSGSFVFGWDGARRQVAAISEVLGVPASSTSIAFVRAARAMGLRRVSVAATYPEDVATHFVSFMARGGVECVRLSARNIVTAQEVGTWGRKEVLDLALAFDDERAEAVLLPDTALHTLAWIDEAERALGKPVLTANQVTVWEGLRIGGWDYGSQQGLGALFRVGVPGEDDQGGH